jgi:hypothetical protein
MATSSVDVAKQIFEENSCPLGWAMVPVFPVPLDPVVMEVTIREFMEKKLGLAKEVRDVDGGDMEDPPDVDEQYEKFVRGLPGTDEDEFDDWVETRAKDEERALECAAWEDECAAEAAAREAAENAAREAEEAAARETAARNAEKERLIAVRMELTRMFFQQRELYETNSKKNWAEIRKIKTAWLRVYRGFLADLDAYGNTADIMDEKRISQMANTANYFNNDIYHVNFTR